EENYRYPGPKPQMRETAITLLADSVEGATRSLDEHTPQNIKDTVHKIVNNKFIDGQLDECPLTLKEIDKISKTFIRILSAMYHGRVKYPEKKKENGNTHKKPSEKNNSQAHQDKEPNQKSS
ncbi:MAG: membrane-associated HD superfamily phosphohydrolase, partial [Lysobacterales bacterium]